MKQCVLAEAFTGPQRRNMLAVMMDVHGAARHREVPIPRVTLTHDFGTDVDGMGFHVMGQALERLR